MILKKLVLIYFVFQIVRLSVFTSCNAFVSDKSKLTKNDTSNFDIKIIYSKESSNVGVFIIPGFGENADSIFSKYSLFNKLNKLNYELIFITRKKDNESLYIKQDEINSLADIIYSLRKNNSKIKSYRLIGFSIGGNACLKLITDSLFCINNKVSSIVVIDPPLDNERILKSLTAQSKNSKSEIAKVESEFLVKFFNEKYNYSSETNPKTFWSNSIVSKNDTLYKKHLNIKNQNILIFSNDDTLWQKQNRDRSLFDMNLKDSELFYGKTKYSNNIKLIVKHHDNSNQNPHSWNNIDLDTLVNWIK